MSAMTWMWAVAIGCALLLAGGSVQRLESAAPAVHECFIVTRPADTRPFVSSAAECARRSSPASTFKIPHALIALQTGVITPDTVFEWDGSAYETESWRRGHDLESAIRWSVLPFFRRTAALIGRDRMHAQLAALGYGADTFDRDLTSFWVNGDLVVSPMEQWSFLERFFDGNLPLEPRHLKVVQDDLRMPVGQISLAAGLRPFPLEWPAGAVVRAKTGNTTVAGERVSWLVGAVTLESTHYVFVARARSTGPLDNTAGAEVARKGLSAHRPRG